MDKSGPRLATLLAACCAPLICTPLTAQEKSSARDMYFGGLEAAAPPATAPATGRKPAAGPKPPGRKSVARTVPAPVRDESSTGKPPVPVINAVQSPLGLRYAILKMNGVDAVEVPQSTHFRSGDRIQLRVQANTDGHLYIVTQGSSGAWRVMFPSPSRNEGSSRVKAGEDHTSIFRFDTKPGVEKLFVVLSRGPERDLDSVLYNLQGTPVQASPAEHKEPMMLAGNLTVNDPLVSRLRSTYTRDMVLEEVAAPETTERAIYVVNKSTGPDARVVADIKLVHE